MSVIYYQKFSENEVFEDAVLNITFNQIYTLLINMVGEELVTNELLVDGDVSSLMQGVVLTTTVSKVELVTANKTIFNLLKSSYGNLKVSQVISEERKLTLVINGKVIEVNYSSVELPKTVVNGIYVKSLK